MAARYIRHIPEWVAKLLQPGDEVSINHENGWCAIDDIRKESDGTLYFAVGANEYTYEYIQTVYANIPGYNSDVHWEVSGEGYDPDANEDDSEYGGLFFCNHNCNLHNPYDGISEKDRITLKTAKALKPGNVVAIIAEGGPVAVESVEINGKNTTVHLSNGNSYNYKEIALVVKGATADMLNVPTEALKRIQDEETEPEFEEFPHSEDEDSVIVAETPNPDPAKDMDNQAPLTYDECLLRALMEAGFIRDPHTKQNAKRLSKLAETFKTLLHENGLKITEKKLVFYVGQQLTVNELRSSNYWELKGSFTVGFGYDQSDARVYINTDDETIVVVPAKENSGTVRKLPSTCKFGNRVAYDEIKDTWVLAGKDFFGNPYFVSPDGSVYVHFENFRHSREVYGYPKKISSEE